MPRLSRREKRLLIVFAAILAVIIIGIIATPEPPPDPEEVLAYYLELFELAEEAQIKDADEGKVIATLTADRNPAFFRTLASFTRFDVISIAPSPYSIKYKMDLHLVDGREARDISIGGHVESPKQPARGKLWFIPTQPGTPRDAAPAVIDLIGRTLEKENARAE